MASHPLLQAFWTWWGVAVLLSINVSLLQLAVSRRARARAARTGRQPLAVLLLLPAGALAVVLGEWTTMNASMLYLVALFVPLMAYAAYLRTALARRPLESLSPAMRWSLEAPGVRALIRNPVAVTKLNVERITQLPSMMRQEREWEREQGLR